MKLCQITILRILRCVVWLGYFLSPLVTESRYSNYIKVVSYNTLAPSYMNPAWYKDIETIHLDWSYRKSLLINKIKHFNADILCLQEVEQELFSDLEKVLTPLNYKGIYAKKGFGKPDGCATFFKKDHVRYKESKTIYYDDHINKDISRASGHIALILYVEINNMVIGFVNTHIRWDQSAELPTEHVGYRQVDELFNKHLQEADNWVICGDFNAEDSSPVITYIQNLGLKDAYKESGLLQATVNINYPQRIDYIFYTKNFMGNAHIIPAINETSLLPSGDEPSDHLAIMANLLISTGQPA